MPPETDVIDPTLLHSIAVGNHEGWDILDNLRTTTGDRVAADAAELVHRRQPSEDRMIPHLHMPSQRPVVREDHATADDAVMRDVAVSEKIPTIADARVAARLSAAIDRHKLAEAIAVPNLQVGRLETKN